MGRRTSTSGDDVEDNDPALVERAQQGDREAFKELVEKYQRKVYSICFGMLKNSED
ncbi:MAG: RNA polymerase sigma factor, partial [Bradymonadaceae bacterium]